MASSQTLPSPHLPRAPTSQVSQGPRVTPKSQNLPNSSDIAKYLSVHQIVSCRQNDPQTPEPSSSPRFLQVLRNAPTNSQDPQVPFKCCQIVFRSQILRPQTLNYQQVLFRPSILPNLKKCPRCHQTPSIALNITHPCSAPQRLLCLQIPLISLLILPRLSQMEPHSKITADMDSLSPLGTPLP